MFRAGLYARVSTNDQQTLAMQNRAMREYAARRGWTTALQVREVNSGAAKREAREKLLESARRREINLVLVWRKSESCAALASANPKSPDDCESAEPQFVGFWGDLFL
jgi:DNA invertase Pin-like site-specific DNA recombinase